MNPLVIHGAPGLQRRSLRAALQRHDASLDTGVVLRDHGLNICDAMLQAVQAPVTLGLTAMTVGWR